MFSVVDRAEIFESSNALALVEDIVLRYKANKDVGKLVRSLLSTEVGVHGDKKAEADDVRDYDECEGDIEDEQEGTDQASAFTSWDARSVRISGANANEVNGVFDPVKGVSEGMPVYRKRDDAGQWLEYYAPGRQWVVTSTEVRGTGGGFAWLHSDPPRLPDHTLGSVWEVSDGDKLVDQPSVSVTLVRFTCDCSSMMSL